MDKNLLHTEIDQVFRNLVHVAAAIPADEFNQVPFEGSWTPGQLTQHVVLSAGGFLEMVNGDVAVTERDPEQQAEGIRKTFLDFSQKFQSPDFVAPEKKSYDQQEMIRMMDAIRQGLLRAVEDLDLSLTCTMFEVPGSGYLTRYEALVFVSVHMQRHLHQFRNMEQVILSKKRDAIR